MYSDHFFRMNGFFRKVQKRLLNTMRLAIVRKAKLLNY